jgi:hypothetical protein
MTKPSNDSYNKEETARRVEAALRAALNTPPQPRKSMTPKRPRAQQKLKKPKPLGNPRERQ